MRVGCKNYLLIISLMIIAILVSGCTININTGDSGKDIVEIESDEDTTTEEATVEESTPTPPARAPQASMRSSRVDVDIFKLEHQGGDDIDLSELQLLVKGMSWNPICDHQEMFHAGDVLLINTYTFKFTLNGNELATNSPTGTYVSSGTTNVKLVDIPTQQLVADMDYR